MTTREDDERSLEQIEQDDWGDPPSDATFLVRRVMSLRRTPLKTLGAEELRIMIGQGVGLTVLVPRALAILNEDPLAQGDFYPGDLATVVARRYDEWCDSVPEAAAIMGRVANAIAASAPDADEELSANLARFRS